MRKTLAALSVSAAFGLIACETAAAVPIDAAGVKAAATTAATVDQARSRHGYTKCYHELVIGPYVCHTYGKW